MGSDVRSACHVMLQWRHAMLQCMWHIVMLRTGIIRHTSDASIVTTPTLMLAHALDMAWSRVKTDTSRIVAISGSGQQRETATHDNT